GSVSRRDGRHRRPAGGPPVGVVVEALEVQLAEADVAGVGVGAGGDALALVVGDDLAQLVGQQRGAGGGAGAAEEVERKNDDGGLHDEPSSVPAGEVTRGL